MAGKIWKLLDIIDWATNYFSEKGISSPRLNIELLLCEVLKIDRVALYLNFEKPLIESELSRLREMVIRRGKREPLQYIIGNAAFMELEIDLMQGILVPRPETEQLAEISSKFFQKEDEISILDIGSGSGCLSVWLAKYYENSKLLAVDVDPVSVLQTGKNLRKYDCNNAQSQQLDILKSIPKGKFDLIVSNPPYIPKAEFASLDPEVRLFEKEKCLVAGDDGLDFYRRFAMIFPKILKDNGRFALEIHEDFAEEVRSIFSEGFPEIKIENDISGKDRFAIN